MRISNLDGLGRLAVSIRERLSRNLVELFREDYPSDTKELTGDVELRRALKLFACEEDESMNPGQFVTGITRWLRWT